VSGTQDFRSRRLWRWLAVVLTITALGFVAAQLVQGWEAIRTYPWQWHPGYLILSFIGAQAGYLVLTRAWRSVLRAISIRLAASTAYWVFILSNLGRYIPGRVWQVGAAALFARSLGLHAGEIATSMVVYQFFLLPVGVLLGLFGGNLQGMVDHPWLRAALLGSCLAMAAAALWPHLLMRLFRPLVHRIGSSPERWRMAWSRKLAVIVQCAIGWTLLSLSFGFLVISTTRIGWEDFPQLSQTFLVSYIVGFVSLVTPGGLGVREGVMTLLLTPMTGAGPAAALSLLSRLWITATEIVALLPAWWWYRRDRRREAC
jgi:uncharacterized membrane protein YbhN (UPF0104 family)